MNKLQELIKQSAEFKKANDLRALSKVNEELYELRRAMAIQRAKAKEQEIEQRQSLRAEAYALSN